MRAVTWHFAALLVLSIAWGASVFAREDTNEPRAGRANRPTSAGPVTLARTSHQEPVDDRQAAKVDPAGSGLALAPPSKQKSQGANRPAPPSGSRAISTVLGSLGVVLGLFFLVAWLTRRVRPKGSQALPKEAVEVLGRAPLAGRQQMHLVRVGGKLLLVSVTPTGAETLTEITDPAEVERLSGLCQMSQPGSITDTFRQVLSQFEKEPAPGGFVGESAGSGAAEAASGSRRRRLARSAS
jgi:flagellar protein FliO/FliZ